MSKLKKQLKHFFDENLAHEDSYPQIVQTLNLKGKQEERIYTMKKPFLKIILPCILCMCLVVGVTIGIVNIVKNKTAKRGTDAVVQMDLNPSVSFVVDKDGKVVSVYGENDEGKMLISGESYTGLKLEVAVEKIINEERKTGYLVKGSAQNGNNNIKFTVETSNDKMLEKMEELVTTTTTKVCEKLDCKARVEVIKQKGKDALVKRAMEIDPTLSSDKASEMSEEELIKYISGCHIEKINIPTKELEELYNKIKEQKIEFAKSEETKKIVETLDTTYQSIINQYNQLYARLSEANKALDDLYVQYFINEDSAYQQAYKSLLQIKAETLALRNEVAQMDDSNILKPIKQSELTVKENALIAAENSLVYAKNTAEQLLEVAKSTINTILKGMEELKAQLPTEIATSINNKLQEVEGKLNEVKDEAIAEFEEKYKTEIENAIQKVQEYKASLVKKLKGE